MSNTHYQGLTWDHPRGYQALQAASDFFNHEQQTGQGGSASSLTWHTQALEGFESAPIGELATAYDLLVLDHPHIGEAVHLDCLRPLEDFFSAAQIAQWKTQTIGSAMQSYYWEGRHWALPLDVAAQVSAYRPDQLPDSLEPSPSWDDVIQLSEKHPVALSLAGPHALLNLYSVNAALGGELGEETLFIGKEATMALDILHRLYSRIPANTDKLNPIALLETMATTHTIALIPLVFGYVNYSQPSSLASQLVFRDAPVGAANKPPGSVLGGTGIALTKRGQPNPDLLEHLTWLMNDKTQTRFIPAHAGQPSARQAWHNAELNQQYAEFYKRTENTIENALVRPRFDGYIRFQTDASAIVNSALHNAETTSTTIHTINTAWHTNHAVSPHKTT